MNKRFYHHGVGLNLRLEYLDYVLEELPSLPFLEIIADNWLSPGAHHQKLEKIRCHYQISFHSVGMNIAGTDQLNLSYLKEIKELISIYQPFQISDHLCFQAYGGNHHHDLLPFPLNKFYLKNVISRTNEIQNFLGRKILLENLSYYLQYTESTFRESEFLNLVSQETECGILLDLNNILVNSKNLEICHHQYLEEIHWQKVHEIHLAGAEYIDDLYIDTHGSRVQDDLKSLIKTYHQKLEDIPILYERDSNLPPFQEIIQELGEIKLILKNE